jgi:hypothetical protein
MLLSIPVTGTMGWVNNLYTSKHLRPTKQIFGSLVKVASLAIETMCRTLSQNIQRISFRVIDSLRAMATVISDEIYQYFGTVYCRCTTNVDGVRILRHIRNPSLP